MDKQMLCRINMIALCMQGIGLKNDIEGG